MATRSKSHANQELLRPEPVFGQNHNNHNNIDGDSQKTQFESRFTSTGLSFRVKSQFD